MLVLTLVGVFEARVAEHQQIHDHAEGKGVCLFRVLRDLLIDLGSSLHPGARDELCALLVLLANEPLVAEAHDEVLVQQDVFRLEVVVREAELLEPEKSVDELAHDDAERDFLESVGVLELVEQLVVGDHFHHDIGV